MQIHYSSAFGKIRGFVNASLQKLAGISKPQVKFLSTVIELWLGLPVRCTMLNLSRFGCYSEKSIRLHFEKFFDFVSFNTWLIKKGCSKELIAAFDPTFITKSGKKTPGLGKWWNGTYQRALKGLEIACLSIVDVQGATAMSLQAVQTPSREVLKARDHNLVSHYVSVIKKQLPRLKTMVKLFGGRWLFHET